MDILQEYYTVCLVGVFGAIEVLGDASPPPGDLPTEVAPARPLFSGTMWDDILNRRSEEDARRV